MADELEYVVHGALMTCDKGTAPGFFNPTYNAKTKVAGCLVTTAMDKLPITNIPSFTVCSISQKPCIPVPTEWEKTYKVKVQGQETLLARCCMKCGLGGKIEFVTSGQIPLPQDALDDIKAMQEAGAEPEEDDSLSWWDAAELIPVIGSCIGIVREAKKGNGWMVAANVGFLISDIAGVVSFGATTAASTAGKTALKTGVKVAGKSATKAAAKKAGKTGLKTALKLTEKEAAEAFVKHTDDIIDVARKGEKAVTARNVFRRSLSERRKALLRDARDPNLEISDRARKFILDNDGKKVPKGYEVSHEKPLYNARTIEGKKQLDVMDNMKTQQKSVHRKRHKVCGNQYHEFGSTNKPKFYVD